MYDWLIVGAGFAGIAAAVALAKAGRRVLLVEARAALGGRAATLTDRTPAPAQEASRPRSARSITCSRPAVSIPPRRRIG